MNSFQYKDQCNWVPDIQGHVAYVLMLENGTRYKGFTSDFKKRMLSHFNGMGSHTTRKIKPIYILHFEVFSTKEEAMERERLFKSGYGYNWLRDNEILFKTLKP